MRKEISAQGRRLMKVQFYSRILAINIFARTIGLDNHRVIDQIDQGIKNIDHDLAVQINKAYPIFRVRWLMTGEGSPYDETADLE